MQRLRYLKSDSKGQASTIGGVFLVILISLLLFYLSNIMDHIATYNRELAQLIRINTDRYREALLIKGIRFGDVTALTLTNFATSDSINPNNLKKVKESIGVVDGQVVTVETKEDDYFFGSASVVFEYDLDLIGLDGNVSVYLSASGSDGYLNEPEKNIPVKVFVYAFDYDVNNWVLLKSMEHEDENYYWYNCTLTRSMLKGTVRIKIKVEGATNLPVQTKGGKGEDKKASVKSPKVWVSVSIDYLAVTVRYFDGSLPVISIMNAGSVSTTITSIWIINSTYHVRIPCNITVPVGKEVVVDLSAQKEALILNNLTVTDPSAIKLSYGSTYIIRICTIRGIVYEVEKEIK